MAKNTPSTSLYRKSFIRVKFFTKKKIQTGTQRKKKRMASDKLITFFFGG